MNKVAVIILNYNTSSDCRKCISFLKRQQGVELEIIIIDNCSQANDCNKVELLCQEQGSTFIPAKENRGYNAGNNIGLRYAAEKGYVYALIANPDMEFPQTDYVAALVTAINEDDDIVAIGSDIIGVDGVHQNPIKRDGNWRTNWEWTKDCFINKRKDPSHCFGEWSNSHYCDKISGCCLMVRIDFIKQVGFFDENVFLYCEEPILSRQVEQAGKRIYYLASSQAIHRHIKSEKGNPVARFKQWKKSRTYFIDHYSGDSMLGRLIAKLSISFYVVSYQLFHKIVK